MPFVGFFQILSDGKLPLMKSTKITVKKADYNAALNVGSPDDKILKSEELNLLRLQNLAKPFSFMLEIQQRLREETPFRSLDLVTKTKLLALGPCDLI